MHLNSDPLSHINFMKIIHNQIKLSSLHMFIKFKNVKENLCLQVYDQ